MVLSTVENGLMTNKMVKDKKLGLMELIIKVLILMDRKMVKDYLNGKMGHISKEILKIII